MTERVNKQKHKCANCKYCVNFTQRAIEYTKKPSGFKMQYRVHCEKKRKPAHRSPYRSLPCRYFEPRTETHVVGEENGALVREPWF